MIDYRALDKAYEEDRVYALQLEVGDICEQGCIYCYMNAIPEQRNQLSDDTLSSIIEDSHRLGISAIEWLGGEPLLREGLFTHMEHAASLGLKNNMWTGGLPLADENILKETARLCQNGLISVHVSTVTPEIYKLMHAERPISDLQIILESVGKLLAVGYPPEQLLNSVTYTGLQSADDMIATIDYFEENFGIKTSLNVYHTYLRPGQDDADLRRFIPHRKDVARVYNRYCRQYGVERFPMNCVNKKYCSATMAVLYDGSVTPCATIRGEGAPNINKDGSLCDIFIENRDELIFKRFKDRGNLPDICRQCKLVDECWGCRSRAFAAGEGIYGRDPRCFRSKN